jgi:hypothetical protein
MRVGFRELKIALVLINANDVNIVMEQHPTPSRRKSWMLTQDLEKFYSVIEIWFQGKYGCECVARNV